MFFLFLGYQNSKGGVGVPFTTRHVLFRTRGCIVSRFVGYFMVRIFCRGTGLTIFRFLKALNTMSRLRDNVRGRLPRLVACIAYTIWAFKSYTCEGSGAVNGVFSYDRVFSPIVPCIWVVVGRFKGLYGSFSGGISGGRDGDIIGVCGGAVWGA